MAFAGFIPNFYLWASDMEISKFEKVKVFRYMGHPAIVLKIVLPEIKDDGEGGFSGLFNGFYRELVSSYECCVAKWLKKIGSHPLETTAPMRAAVSFTTLSCDQLKSRACKKRKGELLAIERKLSISAHEKIYERIDTDIFDTGEEIFLV